MFLILASAMQLFPQFIPFIHTNYIFFNDSYDWSMIIIIYIYDWSVKTIIPYLFDLVIRQKQSSHSSHGPEGRTSNFSDEVVSKAQPTKRRVAGERVSLDILYLVVRCIHPCQLTQVTCMTKIYSHKLIAWDAEKTQVKMVLLIFYTKVDCHLTKFYVAFCHVGLCRSMVMIVNDLRHIHILLARVMWCMRQSLYNQLIYTDINI